MQAAQKPRVEIQDSFGIHMVNSTVYLFQDTCPDGVAIVAPKDRLRFQSNRNTDLADIGGACPHNLNPYTVRSRLPRSQWDQFAEIVDDPLVELFLPIPPELKDKKAGIYLVNEDFNRQSFLVLKNLERLSSPVHSQIQHWSKMDSGRITRIARISNIHPIVVCLSAMEDVVRVVSLVQELAMVKNTRHILLVAGGECFAKLSTLKFITKLKTTLTGNHIASQLTTLPMEALGVRALGRFCTEGQETWHETEA